MEQSRAITQNSASNLAPAFVLLPKAKRDAMSVLYAFCREIDDVADNESVPAERRREQLADWRADLLRACAMETPHLAVHRELQPIIRQYHLPFQHFDELLQGVEMDLDIKRYESYEQLELYCYRVASAVGLLSIEIFGYNNPACRDYAICLGKALQLTNILRDVRADAERGRIYLPLSELARFRVAPEEILRLEYSPRFFDLAGSGPSLHGGGRIDGLGLLAPLAQIGAAPIPRPRRQADALKQRPKNSSHSAHLVPLRRRRHVAKLWDVGGIP